MKKKSFLFLAIITLGFYGIAQKNINNYKYVVVPLQYDFLKGKNVYRLNTFTKYLFKQNGFDVYFTEEELPQDLFEDRCLAMYADVKEVRGGFRKKKIEIILEDCYGNLIMKSDVGDSTKNNHQDAHHEALREAFTTIKMMDYMYNPEEANDLINEQSGETVSLVSEEKTQSNQNKVVEERNINESNLAIQKGEVLNVIKTAKGFQVLDSASNSVMMLLFTDAKDVYIVKDKNAIVFKKAEEWIYFENNGTDTTSKVLKIKF